MARRITLAVVLGLLVMPAISRAQRPSRYGPAMTLDGPAFNPTMTPEWRQAGGSMEAYQQIMMQKMAVQQQAAFQQQMQAYQKWAKANPEQAAALQKQQMDAYKAANSPVATVAPRKGKKKSATNLKAARSSTSKAAAKAATTDATAEKAGETDDATEAKATAATTPTASKTPAAKAVKPAAPK